MNITTRRDLETMLVDLDLATFTGMEEVDRLNHLYRVRKRIMRLIAAHQQAENIDIQAFVTSTQDY